MTSILHPQCPHCGAPTFADGTCTALWKHLGPALRKRYEGKDLNTAIIADLRKVVERERREERRKESRIFRDNEMERL